MDMYKKEIFNYFSRKENFTAAFEIYQLFPEIKNELISLFWRTVKDSLEKKTKDSDWLVKIDDDIFSTYSKLGIHLKSDTDGNIRIIYEQLHGKPYYGVWLDVKNQSLDIEQIKKHSEKIILIENLNWESSGFWLSREYIGEDFNNIVTLKKTLSDNREAFAMELVKRLWELGNEFKADLILMSKMLR